MSEREIFPRNIDHHMLAGRLREYPPDAITWRIDDYADPLPYDEIAVRLNTYGYEPLDKLDFSKAENFTFANAWSEGHLYEDVHATQTEGQHARDRAYLPVVVDYETGLCIARPSVFYAYIQNSKDSYAPSVVREVAGVRQAIIQDTTTLSRCATQAKLAKAKHPELLNCRVDLHFFRKYVWANIPASSIDAWHKDGGICFEGRKGGGDALGGVAQIAREVRGLDGAFDPGEDDIVLSKALQPGEGVLYDDEYHIHGASLLVCPPGQQKAYRDLAVIAAHYLQHDTLWHKEHGLWVR